MGLYPLQELNQPHAGGLHVLGWGPFPTEPAGHNPWSRASAAGLPASVTLQSLVFLSF